MSQRFGDPRHRHPVSGWENLGTGIEEDLMQRIRIERKVFRRDRDRDASLPLDPRDPDILRAKQLLRREPVMPRCERGESNPHALSGTGS